MNTRTSFFVGTLLFTLGLAPFAGCSSSDSGGTGGNLATGGSATGGTGAKGTGGNGTGGTGTGGNGTGGSASGGSDAQPATFATVKTTITSYCGGSGCHGGETPPKLLGETDSALYNTLTTFKSSRCGNRVLVKARAPQDSAFYLAQADMCKPGLERMPKGCDPDTTCVVPDFLEGIRLWIVAGAPK